MIGLEINSFQTPSCLVKGHLLYSLEDDLVLVVSSKSLFNSSSIKLIVNNIILE